MVLWGGGGGSYSMSNICCWHIPVPSPEGLHDVEADGIKDNIGGAEVIEQHDKEAVVR